MRMDTAQNILNEFYHWLQTYENRKNVASRVSTAFSMPTYTGSTDVHVSDRNQPQYRLILPAPTQEIPQVPESPGASQRSNTDKYFALVPTKLEVNETYFQAHKTWEKVLQNAGRINIGCLPVGLGPSAMLKDAPALPDKVPSHGELQGRPVWSCSRPPSNWRKRSCDNGKNSASLETLKGPVKSLRLSYPIPIPCHVTSDPESCHYGKAGSMNMQPSEAPSSLAIMVMAWCYILSVRLLELQGVEIRYTQYASLPRRVRYPTDIRNTEAALNLHRRASPKLARWLSAIMSPNPSWEATSEPDSKKYPPWAAICQSDQCIVVAISRPLEYEPHERPPTSEDALGLLVELCQLHGLGPLPVHEDGVSRPVAPIEAGFYAALAVPFYRTAGLRPTFPTPCLDIDVGTENPRAVPNYNDYWNLYKNLKFYMTVSMLPLSVGSIVWSIFWAPDVNCKLAGPWLAATANVLGPVINERNLELLSRVFIARRPRVGLWWLGICILGSPHIFKFIHQYLTTLHEGCAVGTMACPDMATAQWVGAEQSFVDGDREKVFDFTRDDALVDREAVFRYRHGLLMPQALPHSQGYKPFGQIRKADIEKELWPFLEHGHKLTYYSFTWLTGEPQLPRSRGFRKETKCYQPHWPDRVKLDSSPGPFHSAIALEPSLKPSIVAIRQMLAMGFSEVSGHRTLEATGFNAEILSHSWIKDWLTLTTIDSLSILYLNGDDQRASVPGLLPPVAHRQEGYTDVFLRQNIPQDFSPHDENINHDGHQGSIHPSGYSYLDPYSQPPLGQAFRPAQPMLQVPMSNNFGTNHSLHNGYSVLGSDFQPSLGQFSQPSQSIDQAPTSANLSVNFNPQDGYSSLDPDSQSSLSEPLSLSQPVLQAPMSTSFGVNIGGGNSHGCYSDVYAQGYTPQQAIPPNMFGQLAPFSPPIPSPFLRPMLPSFQEAVSTSLDPFSGRPESPDMYSATPHRERSPNLFDAMDTTDN